MERTVPRPRLYRDAILALLRRNLTHPTVDWIHQELRKREPRVSLATVYRTLGVLVAEGVLCELPFGAGLFVCFYCVVCCCFGAMWISYSFRCGGCVCLGCFGWTGGCACRSFWL